MEGLIMFILQVWLRSKPKHGRYKYHGKVYRKTSEFIEIEKNLYGIRYSLRVIFIGMGLFLCRLKNIPVNDMILIAILQFFLADLVILPLYYVKLSKISNFR